MSFLEKIESAVYLKYVLVVIAIFILAITVWKGVDGFWPTAGILVGAAMLTVGLQFDKIYR